jgi:nonsense-mediated mRNA decay protein 3
MQALCPKCGQPSDVGLCRNCLLDLIEPLSCPDLVEVTVCSVCGSKLVRGRWQISEKNIEEMATDAACESLSIHKDLEDPEVTVNLSRRGETRYAAKIGLMGTFKGLAVEKSCEIPIRIKLTACDRCSRMAGKYFEATVQVRGSSSRPLSKGELDTCRNMALSMADSGHRSGDQLSFVQEIKEVKGGLDIVLGSSQLGRQLSRAIQERFGGKLVESSTLAGRKDGRDVYRTTALVRFPRLKKGDIVPFRGATYVVSGFDGKRTMLSSLSGNRRKVIADEEADRVEVLGNKAEAQKALVLAVDRDIVEIMDPESYKTAFASRPPDFEVMPGEEIAVVRTAKGFVVLG